MNFSPYKISENFIFKKLKSINNGKLILENYDGNSYNFGNEDSILKANIKIHNPKFYFNIIKGGSSALAESYIKNDFQTSNLPSLIELTAKNIDITHEFSGIINISSLNNLFRRLFLSNTRKKSVKYISKHYDLGNEFFSTWLDKTLTYSCGIFEKPDQELEKAQINKYNKLINLIKPKSGDKILEIGWDGGLVLQNI
jgi:Cyclopropane fatty acid synthase and related methyltransferases